jgi:PAS domain S-box-containing protein
VAGSQAVDLEGQSLLAFMNTPSSLTDSTPPLPTDRYRQLVSGIQDYAILTLDAQGHIASWNLGAEMINGYRAEEIVGAHFSRFYPPDSLEKRLPEHALYMATKDGRYEEEGWRIRKDGSRFWADVVITRMLDASGNLIGFSEITRDLTERRNQELILRQSEARFRLLVTGVKDYAIFMLDPQGIVATWNAGAEHIKGYRADEIIGSHFSRFYPPEAISRGLPETELHGATIQGRFEDEGWRLRKDGSRFWANVIITALRGPTGQLVGFSKITRNLTERRQHEEALQLSEERFRLLVDGVTEYAVIMLDADGFVSSWNSGAERINGYTSDEVIGKHSSYFYPSEAVLANKPWEDLAEAREKGRISDEGWRMRKDGTLFWASTVVTALRDTAGHPYGFANVTQDLTSRRHAETLADTAQRMHEFIAMLAHELRNPLAPIRNAVALMGRKGLKDPALESMRQTIDRQSLQLSRLLDELLDVNRIARGNFAIERLPLDIREVVTRAIEASRPLFELYNHKLQLSVPDEPVPVEGDHVRLTQAVVNLLNNAAKYTPQGGTIGLRVSTRGAEVELRVTDNGKGIAREKLEQIFDLFVQLDPNSNRSLGGLGVGLALVRRVVELHGGSVNARSEGEDRGAEFIVRLPLSTRQLKVETGETVSQAAPPALRILVVDDNADSADTMSLLLQTFGQQVRTLYDGRSAVTLASSFLPDLVILDIGMPEMSGYEVARQIGALNLQTKPVLVAVTGWGQEADKRQADDAGFHYHYVKPVSEAVVRQLLDDVAARL